MIRLRRTPVFPLDRYVRCLWYCEGVRARRERALPTGAADLIVRLADDPARIYADVADRTGQRISGPVVCGAQPRFFVLGRSHRIASVGVHFRPGGVGPVLGIPASELTGLHVALEDLWGTEAGRLREQLAAAATPADALAELERMLIRRLSGPPVSPVISRAIGRFGAEPGAVTVAAVAAENGLSPKRFVRDFRHAVGLAPKRYLRIRRLQSVIDQLGQGPRPDWARLAVDHGYYDQSHLIRDFSDIAGLTPARYRPVDAESPNHVAV